MITVFLLRSSQVLQNFQASRPCCLHVLSSPQALVYLSIESACNNVGRREASTSRSGDPFTPRMTWPKLTNNVLVAPSVLSFITVENWRTVLHRAYAHLTLPVGEWEARRAKKARKSQAAALQNIRSCCTFDELIRVLPKQVGARPVFSRLSSVGLGLGCQPSHQRSPRGEPLVISAS